MIFLISSASLEFLGNILKLYTNCLRLTFLNASSILSVITSPAAISNASLAPDIPNASTKPKVFNSVLLLISSVSFALPASIGAAIACPKKKIICLAGDGSIMLNLQELQTIKNLNLNVLIFLINNDGYLSIKQTQKNFFNKEFGSSSKSNLTFPNFAKVANSFGIKSVNLNLKNWKPRLNNILKNKKGPILINVNVDLIQEFEPRLKSKRIGQKIYTPSLEDMYPFLNKSIENKILEKLNDN